MSTIVMERRYDEPQSQSRIDTMNRSIGTCLEVNGVTHLQTLVNADRTRFICTFDAPDAETVRRAIESAGVAYERIWSAEVFKSG
jgi:hypothetical protein